MAKKSATQLKAVKPKENTLTTRERFDEVKRVELFKLDNSILVAMSPKALFDTIAEHRSLVGGEDISFDYAKEICKGIKQKYVDMKAILEELTFEDFQNADDYWDPYACLLHNLEDANSIETAFVYMIEFEVVRPFANNLFNIKKLVQEDAE